MPPQITKSRQLRSRQLGWQCSGHSRREDDIVGDIGDFNVIRARLTQTAVPRLDLCKPGTDDVEITDIPDDIVVLALNVLSIAIQVAGYAAVGFVIWGGIRYMLADGESSKIASAKTTILNALVGLLIVLVAIAIVNFVVGILFTLHRDGK